MGRFAQAEEKVRTARGALLERRGGGRGGPLGSMAARQGGVGGNNGGEGMIESELSLEEPEDPLSTHKSLANFICRKEEDVNVVHHWRGRCCHHRLHFLGEKKQGFMREGRGVKGKVWCV